jgi:hypothetical protein
MLLRNYDNIIAARQMPRIQDQSIATDKKVFGDEHINVVRINSNPDQPSLSEIYPNGFLPFSLFSEAGPDKNPYGGQSSLIWGEGNAEESYDDWKLDMRFSSSQMSYVPGSSKITQKYEDGKWIITYSRIVTAIGEERTIREIGVVHSFSTSYNSTDACLVYRKVLDTEVFVPANGNAILTFTMTINANPNKPAQYEASASLLE